MNPTRRWLLAAALLAMPCGCRQLPDSASVSCSLSAHGVALGTRDGIDFAFLDRASHRIYVARDGGIDVWNARSGAPIGRIRDIDGTTGAIRIFDLDSFEVIGRIPNANSPNGMFFDAAAGTVAAVSARDVRLIDSAAGTVVGDVSLAGSPRVLWSHGNGMLYLRIERRARIVRVNLGARRVDARWPWAACKGSRDLASP
ncbi:MAG TPA: hypothetical protein VJ833_14910 [Rhodanobacteraceae bacterium]|nr:hypothetical protein [Rhodanobacteraceae bacterium]